MRGLEKKYGKKKLRNYADAGTAARRLYVGGYYPQKALHRF